MSFMEQLALNLPFDLLEKIISWGPPWQSQQLKKFSHDLVDCLNSVQKSVQK